MHRSYAEFADMLEDFHATGPDDGEDRQSFWPDCPNPLCGESMDEEQTDDVRQYECLACRCEFECQLLGSSPVFRILAEPI